MDSPAWSAMEELTEALYRTLRPLDAQVRGYIEQEIPTYYVVEVENDHGDLWEVVGEPGCEARYVNHYKTAPVWDGRQSSPVTILGGEALAAHLAQELAAHG